MGAFNMMRRYSLAICGLVALLCGWSLAIGQEPKAPAKAPTTPPAKAAPKVDPAAKPGAKVEKLDAPAPPTGARGAFDQQMEEWKAILKKMRELRSNFQTAKEDEQK